MLNRLKSVFKSFQQHEVRYVVIGGIAAVLYGVPRATFDLDILIEATPNNAQRLLDALTDAGLGTATLTNVDEILANEITIFQDRVRIDVQISTPGLQFETAWERKQNMKSEISAKELRQQIRSRQWTTPTSGAASGYLQANLVMLPAEAAFNFLLFCVRNPKPCPILDVLEPGRVEPIIAPGADLRTDLPRYKIFENGEFKTDVEDVSDFFSDDMVSFLLGCSFSFENAMLAAGLPIRNMEEDKNVSMYVTNRKCTPAGPFSAPLVVTMRPMTPAQAIRAVQVTTRFHLTHGAPVHLGDPAKIGIKDLNTPEFGDRVTVHPAEIPVFWACGVTSQLAATSAPLSRVITHAPGHMFVSDLRDEDLTIL